MTRQAAVQRLETALLTIKLNGRLPNLDRSETQWEEYLQRKDAPVRCLWAMAMVYEDILAGGYGVHTPGYSVRALKNIADYWNRDYGRRRVRP